jgi:hypothetical protein
MRRMLVREVRAVSLGGGGLSVREVRLNIIE